MRRQDKLTKKQVGVLYATYKTGKLAVTQSQMDFLYDMNAEDTDKANEVRLAMVEVIYCVKHDDFESANDVISGMFDDIKEPQAEAMEIRRLRSNNDSIRVERIDATHMTRDDMARSLGLITEIGRFERAWGFPDYSSYSGDPYLDEIGMDIHDLGF